MENKKCDYGCGLDAKFTLRNEKNCCSKSCNQCPALRSKNTEGLKKAHKDGKMRTDHLGKEGVRNWRKGKHWTNDKRLKPKYTEDDIFIINSIVKRKDIKRYLIAQPNYIHKCEECQNSEWLGKQINLELHHKNGNEHDNRKENLILLCPNCHSYTDTFRGKNSNGYKKVSDEQLLEALKNSDNIRHVLIKVGLTPRGNNYKRVYELIFKLNDEALKKKFIK